MSPPVISISTNKQDHLAAARALSAIFYKLGVRHAYIGGFAWSLLGSIRPTEISPFPVLDAVLLTEADFHPIIHDIDVLIQDSNILELRERLIDLDPHFVDFAGFKLYYVTQCENNLSGLVPTTCSSKPCPPVPLGSQLLSCQPIAQEKPASALYSLSSVHALTVSVGIDILHPGVLILTKFKRWSVQHTSTRPKTIRKAASDRSDIQFIIEWLAENSERIRFDEYEGKSKPELLAMIRKYHDKYSDDVEQMEKLRSIMPDDWADMLALTEPDADFTNLDHYHCAARSSAYKKHMSSGWDMAQPTSRYHARRCNVHERILSPASAFGTTRSRSSSIASDSLSIDSLFSSASSTSRMPTSAASFSRRSSIALPSPSKPHPAPSASRYRITIHTRTRMRTLSSTFDKPSDNKYSVLEALEAEG
ncbi:hypothetical protein NUW54_g4481 [Trametes sanguinea]|uniref:Uncharacterized protein n=1 Tax=Trametes sanguinea TaxID=158606 RepID=A0ACC1Q0K7_9APHY|nr:hypothetical protein NUW54_g4481 [Trametes sanguinea]